MIESDIALAAAESAAASATSAATAAEYATESVAGLSDVRDEVIAAAAGVSTALAEGVGLEVTWTDPTAAQIAAAQGYWIIVSETEPAESEMYGVPVMWINQGEYVTPIPVNPPAPLWDDETSSFAVPNGVIGVEYTYSTSGGPTQPAVAGQTVTTTGAFPRNVVVTAEPQPGYVSLSAPTFSHAFPDPSTIVLLTSDGFSGGASAVLAGRMTDAEYDGSPTAWVNAGPDFGINGTGQLTFPATGGGTAYLAFTGTANYRMKVNKTTSGPMQLSHVLSGGAGGTITAYIGSYNTVYADSRRLDDNTPSGSIVIPGVGGTLTDQIGEWTFQTFESTATITKPDGTVITYDLDYDNGVQRASAPSGIAGSHRLCIGSEAASPAVRVDSIKVYKVGF